MRLADLMKILDKIAPLRFAESWDNVGLLAGDPQQDVKRAMLTIDYTAEVAREAAGCDLVISYHSPIFEAIKQVTAPSLVFEAIRRGVAIYSPHTALDAADGGTNDVLARILGITDARPLRPIGVGPWHFKLVTFVPEARLEALSEALFAAGAGWIGNYSHCSFRGKGTGTFLGHEGTSPTVGTPGKLEYADEVRLETIVPAAKLSQVVHALKQSHPYEEPAFDIIQLTSPPEGRGIGRIGGVQPAARAGLIEQIKRGLRADRLLVAGPTQGMASTVACCAGSGGSLIDDALAQKADLYLTGEIRHHHALKAAAAGMTVVCALHSNTERVALQDYARSLRSASPGVEFVLSTSDRDPFSIV